MKDIKCGLMHSIFLTLSGKIYGIGHNEDGQIGLGPKCQELEIDTISRIKVIEDRVIAIECGMNSTFAVTEGGRVYSWGSNNDSVLGLKKKMDKRHSVKKPTEIAYFGPKDIRIEDINAGGKHVVVRDAHHTVYVWGANKMGQCGIGKAKPVFVETPRKIKLKDTVKIVGWRVGAFHSFVVSDKKEWYAFGSNAFRQCIIRGDEFDEKVITPTLIDRKCLPKNCNVDNMEIVCGRETTLILF